MVTTEFSEVFYCLLLLTVNIICPISSDSGSGSGWFDMNDNSSSIVVNTTTTTTISTSIISSMKSSSEIMIIYTTTPVEETVTIVIEMSTIIPQSSIASTIATSIMIRPSMSMSPASTVLITPSFVTVITSTTSPKSMDSSALIISKILPSSSPAIEEDEEQTPFLTQIMIIMLSGGVVILCLFLAIIIVTFLVCRNWRSARKGSEYSKKVVVLSRHEMLQFQSSNDSTPNHPGIGRGHYYAKEPETFDDLFTHIHEAELPVVDASEIHSYVETLEEEEIMDEYEDIVAMDVQFYNFTAGLKSNKNKNRYVDILANEFTRVHLHTPAGHGRYSDYINANYIEGYSRQKEYIAAQGPLEKTAADFWSMVWSEKCRNIVMVTNLIEGDRSKCYKYWPSEGVLLVHSFSVLQQDEQILTDYTIRTFNITLKDERYAGSGESREITQYHFTAWPDHGVPDDTDSMIDFIKRVRSAIHSDDGPIIIHCSAGVGRTGTFIVIDVMLQKLDNNEPLDIMNYVCRMRAQRGSMVQTSLQYMFIYKAMAYAYLSSNSSNCVGENEERENEGGHEGDSDEADEDSSRKSPTDDQQADILSLPSIMSLPSFTSDDYLDMNIV